MKIRILLIFSSLLLTLLPSLPGYSNLPSSGSPNPNNAPTQPPQVDEILDLGTIAFDSKLEPVLRFTVPQNQSFYKISQPQPSPFGFSSTGAYLGAGSSRDIAVKFGVDRNISGSFRQVITISGNNGQPFKQVLIKVNILPRNS